MLRHRDARARGARAGGHPLGCVVLGFLWVYLLCAISSNRDMIVASLDQGRVSADAYPWILGGLSALLAVSCVLLCQQLLRALIRGRRGPRGPVALLLGGAMAVTLYLTPPAVWQLGYGMMDGTSQQVVRGLGDVVADALPNVTLSDISYVVSQRR